MSDHNALQDAIKSFTRTWTRTDPYAVMAYAPAAIVIADAYLAEHPADDGEAVRAEWLGLRSHRGERTFEGADGAKLTVYLGYRVDDEPGAGRWCAVINGAPYTCAVPVPTRGHLRALARIVGVELKEPPCPTT